MKRLLPLLLLSSCQFIPGTDAAKIAEAETAVRQQLADPDTAKFRDERAYELSNGPVVCGAVNAKNQFGAFVGFSLYGYVDKKAIIFPNVSDTTEARLAILNFPRRCLPNWRGEAQDAQDQENMTKAMENLANTLDAKANPVARP